MACKFSVKTVKTAGITPEVWARRYIDTGRFLDNNQNMVEVYDADGMTIKKVPACKAAFHFNKLCIRHDESSSSNFGGGSNMIDAIPKPYLVELRPSYLATVGVTKHTLCKKGDIVIPLCIPKDKNIDAHVVWMDFASKWVTCQKSCVQHHEHHVGNMFAGTLRCTIDEITRTNDENTRMKLLEYATIMISNAKYYMAMYPKVKQVLEPLLQSQNTRVTLERFVAFTLLNEQMDAIEFLRCIEMILKRHFKFVDEINWSKHRPYELIACLLVVPILDKTKEADTINVSLSKLDNILHQGNHSVNGHHYQVAADALKYLIPHIDCDKLVKLLDWCVDRKNYSQPFDIAKWGLKESREPPFSIIGATDNIRVNPKTDVLQTFPRIEIDNDRDDVIQVINTDPSKWQALKLSQGGIYTVTGQLVGGGKQVKGDTHGLPNVANLRFTSGSIILPDNVQGYSASGQLYKKRDHVWGYEAHKNGLDVARPFEIKYIPNKSIIISQGGIIIVNMDSVNQDNLLIAFKFLNLSITRCDLPSSVVFVSTPSTSSSSSSSSSSSASRKTSEFLHTKFK